jgi:thiol-disulfide isomerase/thioredoxin
VLGKPVPAFKSTALDGTAIDLAGLRGKVTLLDFWATWCGPCKREIPLLEKLHQEFREKGLVVVGLNVGEEKATVEKFLKGVTLTYPVVLVGDKAGLVTSLSIQGFPTVVLLDREGNISSYEVGARGEAALRADLAKLGIGTAAAASTK